MCFVLLPFFGVWLVRLMLLYCHARYVGLHLHKPCICGYVRCVFCFTFLSVSDPYFESLQDQESGQTLWVYIQMMYIIGQNERLNLKTTHSKQCTTCLS